MSCTESTSYNDLMAKYKELLAKLEEITAKDFSQDGRLDLLAGLIGCGLSDEAKNYIEFRLENSEAMRDFAQATQEMYTPYRPANVTTESKYDSVAGTDYYVTYVPKKPNFDNLPPGWAVDQDKSQSTVWKLGIANDSYNADTLESTLHFAKRTLSTVVINAGVFDTATNKPVGSLIKDGRIVQTAVPSEDKYQYLAIMTDGSFRMYPRETAPGKMLEDGVRDAVCIFQSLLINGEFAAFTDERKEPRQSMGVDAAGNVYIVTADGRNPGEDAGMTYADLARIHADLGCVDAWALDGGGSASTVVRGVKVNDNIDYRTDDRKVSTFLYTEPVLTACFLQGNAFGPELGQVKQDLIKKIMKNVEHYAGYIRLRGPEGYYVPGVEMYVNGEDARRGKVGMTVDPENDRNSYAYISFRSGDTEDSSLFRIYGAGTYIQTYHGTTAERPNGPVGLQYFDETLNKPIWRGSAGWVDSSGQSV